MNGSWKFNLSKNPASRPVNFYLPKFNVSKWKNIPVPANWEMQGFDVPIYVNHPYEFADARTPITELKNGPEPPRVPTDYIPVGSYRRNFEVPGEWSGREIFIYLGSVKSAFYIWVNGQMVGYSEGSKLPAEFNITRFVVPGKKNTLALEIYRWCTASYLECQDFWRMSGIEREVAIYSQPKIRIRDFEVVSTLDETYRNALLQLFVYLKNHLPDGQNGTIGFSLSDGETPLFHANQKFSVPAGGELEVDFSNVLTQFLPLNPLNPGAPSNQICTS